MMLGVGTGVDTVLGYGPPCDPESGVGALTSNAKITLQSTEYGSQD